MAMPHPRTHAQGDLVGDLSTIIRLFLANASTVRLNCPTNNGSECHIIAAGYKEYATITYRTYTSCRDDFTGRYTQVVTLQTFIVVFENDQCVYVTDTETIVDNAAPAHQLTSSQIRKVLRAAKRCGPPPAGMFFASETQVIQLFEDLVFGDS